MTALGFTHCRGKIGYKGRKSVFHPFKYFIKVSFNHSKPVKNLPWITLPPNNSASPMQLNGEDAGSFQVLQLSLLADSHDGWSTSKYATTFELDRRLCLRNWAAVVLRRSRLPTLFLWKKNAFVAATWKGFPYVDSGLRMRNPASAHWKIWKIYFPAKLFALLKKIFRILS
jgi:hypothetical protein